VSNNFYLLVSVGSLIHELHFLASTSKNIAKLDTLCIFFNVWQELPYKIFNGTTFCSSFEFQVQGVFPTTISTKNFGGEL
jgi:hypothetical protein